MRLLGNMFLQTIWAIGSIIVLSFLPWLLQFTVKLFVKDAYKQQIIDAMEQNDVSAGILQLVVLAAGHPLSTALLCTIGMVGAALLYSLYQTRHATRSLGGNHQDQAKTQIGSPSYEDLLGSSRHWEARCDVVEKQLAEVKQQLSKCQSQLMRRSRK